MPVFGGLRTMFIRPHISLTDDDRAHLAAIQAKACTAKDLNGNTPMVDVLRSLERLRAAGRIKPLPSGKWTIQERGTRAGD